MMSPTVMRSSAGVSPTPRPSGANPEAFWEAMWGYANFACDVLPDGRAYECVVQGLERMAPPQGGQGPRWFPGARLNAAEQFLRRRDAHPALVAWTEQGRERSISYAELARDVARCAHGLRALGVQP
ncbi:MAG: hypothetical protein MUD17_14120, partial [Gemmatimonadaceae bacterium]|nr:hypothetical protein [Gemmatimonadaceae bacterium]